jgi:3-deoxy-D-arabino-heptulosonate 7-phosphate (DAHP) synthase
MKSKMGIIRNKKKVLLIMRRLLNEALLKGLPQSSEVLNHIETKFIEDYLLILSLIPCLTLHNIVPFFF